MKNMISLGLLLVVFLFSGCGILGHSGKTEKKPPIVNIDSLANAKADSIIKAKLGNTEIKSTFNRPIDNNIYLIGDNYKDEIYVIPGMILMLYKDSGKIRIGETGYFVRKKDATLDIEIKADKPFLSSIIEKGFNTNVEVLSYASASLDSKSKLSIDYKTIQVVILEPNEIDIIKADSIIDKILNPRYQNDTTVLGYFIVRSASLNLFSLTKFSKVESGIQANGMAFQAGADIFYKSNTEENSFEVVLKGITRKETYSRINKGVSESNYKWIELKSLEPITKAKEK